MRDSNGNVYADIVVKIEEDFSDKIEKFYVLQELAYPNEYSCLKFSHDLLKPEVAERAKAELEKYKVELEKEIEKRYCVMLPGFRWELHRESYTNSALGNIRYRYYLSFNRREAA